MLQRAERALAVVGVAQRHRQRVGGVGLWRAVELEQAHHHGLHLLFAGVAVADHRLLDLQRGVFGNRQIGQHQRRQRRAARLAQQQGRGRVDVDEHLLDGGFGGLVQAGDFGNAVQNGADALGQRRAFWRADAARGHILAMLAVQIHHAKAGDARARVDAQHPARRAHAPAASARASSSRAGVPTSSHWPSQHSPLTWPRAMAARSSGASLAGAWAGVSANRAG